MFDVFFEGNKLGLFVEYFGNCQRDLGCGLLNIAYTPLEITARRY